MFFSDTNNLSWKPVILLLSMALTISCAGPGTKLKSRIALLQDSHSKQQAERFVRSKGFEGMDALVYASRALGDEGVISSALRQSGCPMVVSGIYYSFGEKTMAETATSLVMRWMETDPGMFAVMTQSKDPLKRALALISQTGNPKRFVMALKLIEKETDPFVLQWGVAMGYTCAMFRNRKDKNKKIIFDYMTKIGPKLVDSFKTVGDPASNNSMQNLTCEAPQFSAQDKILDMIKSGSLEQGAESWSNGVLDISFKTGPNTGHIGSRCALRLYKKAAEAGKYPAWLLMPLVGYLGFTPFDMRTEAANLLARDLEHFPQERRNKILAHAVLAGAKTDRKVSYEKRAEGFQDYFVLSAAASQGDAEAKNILIISFFCRDTNLLSNSFLLGFSKDPNAANQAYLIAKKCSPSAKPRAFEALLRLGDPRALEIFDEIAKADFNYTGSRFIKTMAEVNSPEIISRLKKLAGQGDESAKNILEKLYVAQKTFSESKGVRK